MEGHSKLNVSSTGCTTKYCVGEKLISYNTSGMRAIFSLMFWRVLDGDMSSAMIQNKENYNNKTSVFSLEFSHAMGLTMWAMYQGLAAILLINLLVALMNSTYMKVWQNVDMEWKFSRTFFQVQYLAPRTVFPPPFRWLYYFAKLGRWIRRQRGGKEQSSGKESQVEEYMDLVHKLILTKIQSDKETTVQDDFKDLKIDLRNIIEDGIKKEAEELHSRLDDRIIKELQTLSEKI